MKVQHYECTAAEPAEDIPGLSVRWVISEEDGAPNFAMRVFDVASGAASPFHQHPWEHEVFILQGKGAVKGATGETPFEAGYVVYVKPDEQHQFVNKGDDILRFICLIPHLKK